jgi:hypothetical protein
MGWGRILEASPPSKDCQECATAISSKKNDTKSPPFTRQVFLSKPSQTGLEEPAAPGKPEQSESPRLDGQEEQAGEGMAGSARGPGGTRALKPADSSARRGGKSPHRQEGCALALIVSPKKLTSPRLFVIVRRFRKNASVRVS